MKIYDIVTLIVVCKKTFVTKFYLFGKITNYKNTFHWLISVWFPACEKEFTFKIIGVICYREKNGRSIMLFWKFVLRDRVVSLASKFLTKYTIDTGHFKKEILFWVIANVSHKIKHEILLLISGMTRNFWTKLEAKLATLLREFPKQVW